MCNLDTLLQGSVKFYPDTPEKGRKCLNSSGSSGLVLNLKHQELDYERLKKFQPSQFHYFTAEYNYRLCLCLFPGMACIMYHNHIKTTTLVGQPTIFIAFYFEEEQTSSCCWNILPRSDAGLSFIVAISVGGGETGRGERFIIMQNFMDFQFWLFDKPST